MIGTLFRTLLLKFNRVNIRSHSCNKKEFMMKLDRTDQPSLGSRHLQTK